MHSSQRFSRDPVLEVAAELASEVAVQETAAAAAVAPVAADDVDPTAAAGCCAEIAPKGPVSNLRKVQFSTTTIFGQKTLRKTAHFFCKAKAHNSDFCDTQTTFLCTLQVKNV